MGLPGLRAMRRPARAPPARSVRFNEVPGRGTLATISKPDKSFECHIRIDKVRAGSPGQAGCTVQHCAPRARG